MSKTGLASYRTLNNLFGMKAPVMGVPLKRSTWDGYLDSTPAEFTHHEMRHGALQDSDTLHAIEPSYAIYRKLNSVVKGIVDRRTQSLCDFWLTELGHEHIFGIRPDFRVLWDGVSNNRPLMYPPLEEVCEVHLQRLEERTHQICQSVPIDESLWNSAFGAKVFGASEPMAEYYANISMLRYFVNPTTQQLFSLQEIIIQNGLPKTKSLGVYEIVNPYIPGFIPEIFAGFIPNVLGIKNPVSWKEFSLWYKGALGVSFYNQLIDLNEFSKKQGLPFDLWNGDEFQTEGVIAFFRLACDTFKAAVLKK